jgi:hypothetical protein
MSWGRCAPWLSRRRDQPPQGLDGPAFPAQCRHHAGCRKRASLLACGRIAAGGHPGHCAIRRSPAILLHEDITIPSTSVGLPTCVVGIRGDASECLRGTDCRRQVVVAAPSRDRSKASTTHHLLRSVPPHFLRERVRSIARGRRLKSAAIRNIPTVTITLSQRRPKCPTHP